MSKQYWENFWKLLAPTAFAEFCVADKIFNSIWTLVDVGCGTGRDTVFLSKHCKSAMGMDYAVTPITNSAGVDFKQISLEELVQTLCVYDAVYSRFFLHCVSPAEQLTLLQWTKKIFMAEWRDKGDAPGDWVNKDHKRYLLDSEQFKETVIKEGFTIHHFSVGRGRALYRTEDPLVGRIICERMH